MAARPADASSPAPDEATSLHVHRATAGDEASVAWLVERLNPMLLAQAAYRIGAPLRHVCDPADLVQEAWLILLPRLPSIVPRGGRMTPVLLTFLSSTILHRVQNLLRREARRAMHANAPAEVDEPAADAASPSSGVVSAIVRSERQCEVRAALERLPEKDREIVLMRGIEQHPLEELADLLGESRQTLSKRYCRALERLRHLLPQSVFTELQDE